MTDYRKKAEEIVKRINEILDNPNHDSRLKQDPLNISLNQITIGLKEAIEEERKKIADEVFLMACSSCRTGRLDSDGVKSNHSTCLRIIKKSYSIVEK